MSKLKATANSNTSGIATRKYLGRNTSTTADNGSAINSHRGSRAACGQASHHKPNSGPIRQQAALHSTLITDVGGKK